MLGDKVFIEAHHRNAANTISTFVLSKLNRDKSKKAICVAGESGSGKSEIATEISLILKKNEVSSVILRQDDYFVYPPKINDLKRREDLGWRGVKEVKLELLNTHVNSFQKGLKYILVPSIEYDSTSISLRKLFFNDIKVLIVEGTYTSLLNNIDHRIFIARDFNQTLKHRLKRNRGASELDDFTNEVLKEEHEIISKHKRLADIVIDCNYAVDLNPKKNC